ncbi:MAG: hypothetical protein ABFC78_09580 [Methanoregula sp.]
MTNRWVEWFMGRDADDLNWYNFTEARPVWKTWWFWGGIVLVCGALVWYFGLA